MFDIEKLDTWQLLLVDDDADNAGLVQSIMSFYDVKLEIAVDGVEGLEKLGQTAFNTILLDLSMPKMDGWDMLAKLRDDPTKAHIPVIAFTAHAMAGDEEKVIEAGFDGYIAKPIDVATFLSDLKRFLSGIPDERLKQL